MWGFLLTPWGRRIAIGAGILIVGGFALRWWGNKQWEAGRRDGQADMASELQKAANDAREKTLAEVAIEREALLRDQTALEDALRGARRQSQILQQTIDTKLAAIDASLKRETLDVATLPVGGIPDRIRAANSLYRARRAAPQP